MKPEQGENPDELAIQSVRSDLRLLAEIRAIRIELVNQIAHSRTVLAVSANPKMSDSAAKKLRTDIANKLEAKLERNIKVIHQAFLERIESENSGLAALLDDRPPEDIQPL